MTDADDVIPVNVQEQTEVEVPIQAQVPELQAPDPEAVADVQCILSYIGITPDIISFFI